jgi:hypothetical protein
LSWFHIPHLCEFSAFSFSIVIEKVKVCLFYQKEYHYWFLQIFPMNSLEIFSMMCHLKRWDCTYFTTSICMWSMLRASVMDAHRSCICAFMGQIILNICRLTILFNIVLFWHMHLCIVLGWFYSLKSSTMLCCTLSVQSSVMLSLPDTNQTIIIFQHIFFCLNSFRIAYNGF